MEGKPPTFSFSQPEEWLAFVEDFSLWFYAKGILAPAQKRGLFYNSICEETRRRLKEWIHPLSIALVDYADLIETIAQHIQPAVNQCALFNSLVCRFQKDGESGAQYLSALETLAANLGFGWHTSRLVLFQFKRGLQDQGLQEQLYAKSEIDSIEALRIVTASETSKSCVRQPKPVEDIHALSFRSRHQQSKTVSSFCFRCGEEDHVKPDCKLKYKDCKCNFCKGAGNLETACIKKRGGKVEIRHLSTVPAYHKPQVQALQPPLHVAPVAPAIAQLPVQQAEAPLHQPVAVRGPVNCEDIFYEMFALNEAHNQDAPIYLTLRVENVPVKFQVDNGASKTSIALETFHNFFGNHGPALQQAACTLYNWGSTHPASGLSQSGFCVSPIWRQGVSLTHRGNSS